MPDATFNLASLIRPDDQFYDRVIERSRTGLKDAQNLIVRTVAGLRWNTVERKLREKASALLNQDVSSVLVQAWGKYGVLSEMARASKENDDTTLLALTEHTIDYVLQPYLEVQIGSFSQRIDVDITLSLTLKGLELSLERGRITAIESGTVEGSGKIECAGESLWEDSLEIVDLPGKIDLGQGIALP